ncbi:MAG: hypothetical protein IH953_05115 [Chloroflexi bacterium]|nr:hypothetical protein [Chloroflexota bacterium]
MLGPTGAGKSYLACLCPARVQLPILDDWLELLSTIARNRCPLSSEYAPWRPLRS